jgi:hypothetical protein
MGGVLIKTWFQVHMHGNLVNFPNLARRLLQDILQLGGAPFSELGDGLFPQFCKYVCHRVTGLHHEPPVVISSLAAF